MKRMAVPRPKGLQRSTELQGVEPRGQNGIGASSGDDPTPPAERTGFRYLLGQRDFQLIWYAQVGAQLADKFLMFSLIILAYHLSRGSTPVAITLLAYTVPAVAIAPLAGVLADRFDRKSIMVTTNLVRALLVMLIPLASLVPALRHDYVHLLVITFAFAAVGQLFSPAEAAAIPTVVSRETLITANSMVLATMVVTLVVGGVLAPIASRLDIYAPYWFAVLLFLVAGGLIWFARVPRPDPAANGPRQQRHPFHQVAVELKDGFAALATAPVLLLSFYELALAVLVVFMMFTLAPAYVSQVLGIEAQDSYVILLPATIGALAAAAVLGQLGRKVSPPTLLVGALAATGVTLVLLATAPALLRQFEELRAYARWAGSAFSLLLGLEFGALLIPALTYLMENTSDSIRGRIFALLFMVINGVTAVPVLLTAVLSDWFGINHVIGALGVLVAGTGVFMARYARQVFATAREPG